MIGLAFLAVITLWGFVCYKLAGFIFKRNEHLTIKKIGVGALTVFFFLLPVVDEIIGGFQFRYLCKENVEVFIDKDNAKNKVVIYKSIGNKTWLNYFVPISKNNTSYVDAVTGELLIGWNTYRAKGGWLSRSLNLMESNAPYTFNGVCGPEKFNKSILSDLNITVSN